MRFLSQEFQLKAAFTGSSGTALSKNQNAFFLSRLLLLNTPTHQTHIFSKLLSIIYQLLFYSKTWFFTKFLLEHLISHAINLPCDPNKTDWSHFFSFELFKIENRNALSVASFFLKMMDCSGTTTELYL